MGVRRVALVEDRVAELDRRSQVRIQLGQATAGDEALVDDGPARRRRHRQLGHGPAGVPGGGLQAASGDDEPALEGIVGDGPRVGGAPSGARDERLGDGRTGRGGRGAQRAGLHRDGPPGRDRELRVGEDALDESARGPSCAAAPGQEQHDDRRAIPGGRRSERLEERWIQRQRDAGTVARFAVRPERPAMGERREPGEREWEDPRPRPAAGIRHEAHAASVVLEPRVVERSGGTSSVRWHRLSPGRWLRRGRSYGRSGSGGGTKIPIGRTPRRQDW